MLTSFKNKYGNWALITGATSGIGAELTSQIAAKSINIILVARKEMELKEHTESLIKRYGIEAKYVSADLSTVEGVEVVKQVQEDVSLLVIAAGIEVNGAFEKTLLEQEMKLLNINVIATLQLTHHFSKKMVQKRKGGILMISSLSGHMPNPYFSNYAASKAYVLNLAASLYGELKPKGVDISVLSPGLTNTPMVSNNGMDWNKTPLKAMDPSIVAEVGLNGLGKRLVSVPGSKNKIMAFMAKHSSLQMQTKMNEKMVRKAINSDKI